MSKNWQDKIVYQVYMRSFFDSNGDGVGDINGLICKLDYIKELGADIIWLNPIYCSPNADYGYDISDYLNINPEYGTLDDFDRLVAEAKTRGMEIIMDLVINHTSSEHAWFKLSQNPNSPYHDYYIWQEGTDKKPPNNWDSFFGGSAWEKCQENGKYYLHLFDKNQPDLNLKNPAVKDEIKKIIRFWLDRGVVGFRCDVINIIYKSSLNNGKHRIVLRGLEHYLNQDGCMEFLSELNKELFAPNDCLTVGESVFVDIKSANELAKYLTTVFEFDRMSCDCFFGVKYIHRKFKPKRLFQALDRWQNGLSINANYLENHDQPRSVSRFIHPDFYCEGAKMLAMLNLCLSGISFIYQGQELGMTNAGFESMSELRDVEAKNMHKILSKIILSRKKERIIFAVTRDNARTPMQWNFEQNAGFSTGIPWIRTNPHSDQINVLRQCNDATSPLIFYRRLIAQKKALPQLNFGAYKKVFFNDKIFVFKREIPNKSSVIVAINFSPTPTKFSLPPFAKILLDTHDINTYNGTLLPYQALLLTE